MVAPFERRVRAHVGAGLIELKFPPSREPHCPHQWRGYQALPARCWRYRRLSAASNRAVEVVGEFEISAGAVIVTSGGIGGDFGRVRKSWPVDRLGPAPKDMVAGVPHHVDGRMIDVALEAGAATINTDRMWHYTEGVKNWDPILAQSRHPHPARPLIDVVRRIRGKAGSPLPAGFDTMSTLKRILSTGHAHSWFILTQSIIRRANSRCRALGAEPRPYLRQMDERHPQPPRCRRPATGEGLYGQGRGIRRARTISPISSPP